jgi:prepilin peptidase CpaA
LAASYCDVRSRRIPNWLTGSLALAALAAHSFSGLRAVAISLLVMAVLTAAGTLIYSKGGIGGGDIKLAIAASGMLSYPLCVPFLLYSAIGGGILAVAFIVFRGNARASLARAVSITMGVPQEDASRKSAMLPYAVAFAFGAALIALSQSVAPFLRITL